jgi:DNA recombination protein RmuC
MSEFTIVILLGAVALVVVLQLVLLLRKSAFETPADLSARMSLLEQGLQAIAQAGARSEARSERVEEQLRTFTEATAQALEASRRTLDEKLEKQLKNRVADVPS